MVTASTHISRVSVKTIRATSSSGESSVICSPEKPHLETRIRHCPTAPPHDRLLIDLDRCLDRRGPTQLDGTPTRPRNSRGSASNSPKRDRIGGTGEIEQHLDCEMPITLRWVLQNCTSQGSLSVRIRRISPAGQLPALAPPHSRFIGASPNPTSFVATSFVPATLCLRSLFPSIFGPAPSYLLV
jgi:hypothetical protein